MQLPLFLPDTQWKPPRISDLPSWSTAKRIGFDTETFDADLRRLGPGVRRGAYIAGVSFALEDGPKFYLPLRHLGGDNMEDPAQAWGWLCEQAKGYEGEIVGTNLGYDLDFCWHAGMKMPNVKAFRDIQVYEALIDELQMSYSLETISNKYLNIGKTEDALRGAANAYGVDAKKDMHMLPARFAALYAEDDAAHPLKILRKQERKVEEQELERIIELETRLLPVLVRMRQRGVRVDLNRLERVEQWSRDNERQALAEVERLTGVRIPFNSVWQAAALVPALEAIGCKIPLTPKTKKPSIDKAFLASIDHPVAKAINRARRVNKVRTTFVQSIRDHAIGDRIHATIHQLRSSDDDDDVESGEGTGARYGRCSSQNPNMQQQPARDPEIGPMWRDIYIPEEGDLWCSADFSSQEPRQAVHYAVKAPLGNIRVRDVDGEWALVDADKSAEKMAEKYRTDPSTDPHQALANIIMGRVATKEERSNAKIIFLGLSYGMGGAKLCRSLGLPTIMAVRDPVSKIIFDVTSTEGQRLVNAGQRIYEAAGAAGQALLDKFDASVPFVRALNKYCEAIAKSQGYIRTGAGRKCRFPRDAMGNIEFSHKALNRLIQGSAADQTKAAMIEIDREGFFMNLTIHDEIGASVKTYEEGKKIAEIMENVYKLAVPSKVDVEVGESWGKAK